MKAHWHKLSFDCSCGLPGTILEVCICVDGSISITGLCVVCGKDFSVQDNMALLIAKSAIQDFIQCKKEHPQEFLLEDFNPTGKPS